MDSLTSKLQYKNYEQGEFIDEQERSLDETLELIKNFPWNEQRGVTIEMTCPSVTIYNLYYGYLKIAIYFNGKFIAYHLDNEKHLYERPLPNLDDVAVTVTKFFNQNLDLSKYDKKIFSFGASKDFKDGDFDYRVSESLAIIYFLPALFFIFLFGLETLAFINARYIPLYPLLLLLFFDALMLHSLYFIWVSYSRSKDMCLSISAGKQQFHFRNKDGIQEYDKNDVKQVNVYGHTGRNSRMFNLMEIVFKSGYTITIPGLLIDPFVLARKFPDTPIEYKGGFPLISKRYWNYILKR